MTLRVIHHRENPLECSSVYVSVSSNGGDNGDNGDYGGRGSGGIVVIVDVFRSVSHRCCLCLIKRELYV
jgi:hypothetical protein